MTILIHRVYVCLVAGTRLSYFDSPAKNGSAFEYTDVLQENLEKMSESPEVYAPLKGNLRSSDITAVYDLIRAVLVTWKLKVDGTHDLKPIQNKDCVLGVLRSKTKNILSPGIKSIPTNVKFDIQRLDPSTQYFWILVTTTNLYFSCPAKGYCNEFDTEWLCK